MLSYIVRRILATIPVVLMVALFVFSLLYIAPGDPAAIIAGDQATPADVERIRASLGLDRPFLVRFFDWFWHVLHGDLGTSIFTNLPVSHMIAQRIEPTVSLMVLTLILSLSTAIPMGVIAAWKHGTWIDRAVMALAVLGFSTPVFVIGYVLAYIFALRLDWLPVQGFTSIEPGSLAVPAQPDPALGRARPDLHGADRTDHPRDDAGRAVAGLCANGEGEGRRTARRAVRSRIEERSSADRHSHRHRLRCR